MSEKFDHGIRFETYNTVAVLYLSITIALSVGLKALENRMRARHAK